MHIANSTESPSVVARKVAAYMWPCVQSQQMIMKGVYWFSCAGHGGCVAVRGVADIGSEEWEVAIRRGHTLADTRSGMTLWIGEEDCEWSTIFVAHNDTEELVRRADAKGFRFESAEYCVDTCSFWFPDTLADLQSIVREEVNAH